MSTALHCCVLLMLVVDHDWKMKQLHGAPSVLLSFSYCRICLLVGKCLLDVLRAGDVARDSVSEWV
jgi:hypothetical protein